MSENDWNINQTLDRLKKYSFPRLSNTDSLKKARDIIYNQLKENVPDAEIMEFKCRSELNQVLRFWAPIFLGLIFLTAILWQIFYLLSIITAMLVVSLNLLAQGRFGHVQVSKRFNNSGPIDGYNIVGKINAQEKEKKILVIGAHYDSKSGLSWKKKNSAIMTYSVLLVNLLFIVFSIIRIFIDYSLIWWFSLILWIGSAVEFISTAIYTLLYSVHNESPGANDNGSGVAVILELAAIFSKSKPKNITLLLALFDAEEIGLQGAAAMVSSYHSELLEKNAWMINLDEVGANEKMQIITRGGLPPIDHGRVLNPIFEKAIEANEKLKDLKLKEKIIIDAKTLSSQSDHAPFFIAGIPSVYISTGNKKRHSAADSFENVIPESVKIAGIIVKEFITTLDENLINS